MRVGVLTGGGDCPGLNAVIRAVVRKGVGEYGFDLVGFKDGWRGPLENVTTPLGIDQVRGILPRGGTILKSSRTNPFRIDNGVEKIKENLAANGVDALIAIGGEDTLGVATRLADEGVAVVGVPKTIDNDLSGTDFTFGFDTAVNIAMEAIDRLHTTAESHHRVLVVEVMGRHAGWIALHAGLAGGANVVLIPEQPFDIDRVCEYVEKRFQSHYWSVVRRTRSATSGSVASATGSPARSSSAPARRPGPWCSGTCSAVAPRPPSTGGSRPASACTRSQPSRRRTSARWSRCAEPTSPACRSSRAPVSSSSFSRSSTPRRRSSSADPQLRCVLRNRTVREISVVMFSRRR